VVQGDPAGEEAMNVAFVGSWPAEGREAEGGVEVATTRLAAALAAQGVGITVFAPGKAAKGQDGPIRVVRLPVAEDGRLLLLRGLKPWRRAVAAALPSFDVDLVHGHGLLEGGLPAVDAAAPSVVSAHGNHAMDTRAARSGAGAELRILAARRLALRVVNRADAIVSVNPDPHVNLPGAPRRFAYVPSIVDDVFRRPAAAPSPGRVLYCGGARRIKGADLLAEAWPRIAAAVPESSLEVVGWPAGRDLPETLRAAERRGWLAAGAFAEALTRAAVVVIPSRFEVAPVTLLEAWSVGVPVVATRVGGVPRLAEGAAILVEPAPAAIAAGVVEALSGRGTEELVAEGRRRAELARPDAVARAHLALYEELAS
jgi:glycosyltransferase involved in cell wall biosynthesis